MRKRTLLREDVEAQLTELKNRIVKLEKSLAEIKLTIDISNAEFRTYPPVFNKP
jgi:hypothetical protein